MENLSKKNYELIKCQITHIRTLKRENQNSIQFQKWKFQTQKILDNIFGTNSYHSNYFNNLFSFLESKDENASQKISTYRSTLDSVTAFLLTIIEDQDLTLKRKDEIFHSDKISLITYILRRFHIFSNSLKTRSHKKAPIKISNEYDIQYLLHAILLLFIDDVKAEEWTPSYGGGASRIDFALFSGDIIIETKKTRKNLRDREISDELFIDIKRYHNYKNTSTLFCFVYDPDFLIKNASILEYDLTGPHNSLNVITIISPKP